MAGSGARLSSAHAEHNYVSASLTVGANQHVQVQLRCTSIGAARQDEQQAHAVPSTFADPGVQGAKAAQTSTCSGNEVWPGKKQDNAAASLNLQGSTTFGEVSREEAVPGSSEPRITGPGAAHKPTCDGSGSGGKTGNDRMSHSSCCSQGSTSRSDSLAATGTASVISDGTDGHSTSTSMRGAPCRAWVKDLKSYA